MADEKLIASSGQPWKIKVDRAGTLELKTAGKFLDRNFDVQVDEAEIEVSANAAVKDSISAPTVTASIEDGTNSITKATTVTTTKPSTGKYFEISPVADVTATGSAVISTNASVAVSKEGYLASEQAVSGQAGTELPVNDLTATVASADTYYLPVAELDNSIITASTKLVENENGTKKDSLTVTVQIPTGYHEGDTFTKTFDDLIPDFAENAATVEQMLAGYKAYDQDGKELVGSMANHSLDKPVMNEDFSSSSEVTGSQVTLTTENKSGISVTGKGSVTASASIPEAGYWVASESTEKTYESEAQTKYISEIVVGEEKVLDKITVSGKGTITDVINNGTINELSGNGTISELSGIQEITKLTGTVDIKNALDQDPDAENSEGKVIFNGTTIVADGEIVKSTQQVDGDQVVITPGWVTSTITQEIESGAYEVSGTSVNDVTPTVTFTQSVNNIITTDETTPYSFTYGGDVTAGSYTATATITKSGFLAVGSKSTDPAITINVDKTNNGGTKFIQEATFPLIPTPSADKYADNEDVPETYEFTCSKEGYTKSGLKASVPVFDGTFAWV